MRLRVRSDSPHAGLGVCNLFLQQLFLLDGSRRLLALQRLQLLLLLRSAASFFSLAIRLVSSRALRSAALALAFISAAFWASA